MTRDEGLLIVWLILATVCALVPDWQARQRGLDLRVTASRAR